MDLLYDCHDPPLCDTCTWPAARGFCPQCARTYWYCPRCSGILNVCILCWLNERARAPFQLPLPPI